MNNEYFETLVINENIILDTNRWYLFALQAVLDLQFSKVVWFVITFFKQQNIVHALLTSQWETAVASAFALFESPFAAFTFACAVNSPAPIPYQTELDFFFFFLTQTKQIYVYILRNKMDICHRVHRIFQSLPSEIPHHCNVVSPSAHEQRLSDKTKSINPLKKNSNPSFKNAMSTTIITQIR